MKLPSDTEQLNEIFKRAALPDISDFNGEYLVDMLTVFPSFKRFSHRKIFYPENGRIVGYNVLFNKIWGRFYVQEDVCGNMDSLKAAVINYDRKKNMFHIRRIRDYVRCVEKGSLYIGRFNYLLCGRLFFLGYFSLEKVK